MKYSNLTKKHDSDPGTFSFRYVCSKYSEQGFNIRPWNRATSRTVENLLQSSLVLPFHYRIVPYYGTMSRHEAYNVFAEPRHHEPYRLAQLCFPASDRATG